MVSYRITASVPEEFASRCGLTRGKGRSHRLHDLLVKGVLYEQQEKLRPNKKDDYAVAGIHSWDYIPNAGFPLSTTRFSLSSLM